jgi:23S rRNA (cytidine1920-2'-O)/16S rRNA (cytidine1409-2'-O)-methyltransferase
MVVDRGLAESRARAQALILAGKVFSGDRRVEKPGEMLAPEAPLAVRGQEHPWVSRGGLKLAHGLRHFGLSPAGRVCLDVGASTGGFTDVLLRAGAARVLAVDVGYGQLAWSLQSDDRVAVMDRTNVRELTLDGIGGEPVDLVVGDLSFIPLGLVLPALSACAAEDADLVLMVKPQFEVGRERLGSGGVVRSGQLRLEMIEKVAAQGAELGYGVRGVTASPLPGPSGNVEYFLWFRRDAPPLDPADAERAVREGPR